MRLRAEQLLETFKLTKDYFADASNTSDLSIVADTIVPITPRRVEELVPVQTSAEQTIGGQNRETNNEAIRERNVEENASNANEAAPHSTSDTVKHIAPKKPKEDAPAVRSMRADSVPVVSTPVRIVVPAAENGDAGTDLLYSSISRQAYNLPSDTINYSVVMDSLVVDTVVHTAEAKNITSFSLDGQKEGVQLPMKLDRSDGIFALLLVCFLLLAHVYNGGIAFFKENIMLVFSASKSEKLETQTTTKEIFYSYFLVFLAVLLISISLYEALDRFMPLPEGEKRPFVTIGLFIALMIIFILVKIRFNKLIGYIFDFDKRLNTWNRSYMVLLSILGLLCFFPTLILVYSSIWHSIIIGFVLVLFLIVQIILFLRIIVFFIGQKFNFLYLIAYLCTIEILPYIFLGIGLVYLYRIDIFNTIL